MQRQIYLGLVVSDGLKGKLAIRGQTQQAVKFIVQSVKFVGVLLIQRLLLLRQILFYPRVISFASIGARLAQNFNFNCCSDEAGIWNAFAGEFANNRRFLRADKQ